MLMFGDAMSIFARSTWAPSGKLAGAHPPEEIEVLVDGPESGTGCRVPGSVSVPRFCRISSLDWLST